MRPSGLESHDRTRTLDPALGAAQLRVAFHLPRAHTRAQHPFRSLLNGQTSYECIQLTFHTRGRETLNESFGYLHSRPRAEQVLFAYPSPILNRDLLLLRYLQLLPFSGFSDHRHTNIAPFSYQLLETSVLRDVLTATVRLLQVRLGTSHAHFL